MPDSEKTVILVTGAGGWLGGLVASHLARDPRTKNPRLILADLAPPVQPPTAHGVSIGADLADPAQVQRLFETPFGVPDIIYCLHGIMSRGAEDHFDLGMKVNFDAVRLVLEAARQHGKSVGRVIKFIFTSSLAVYGGPVPHVVLPETIATPQSAYGAEKLMGELIINEYTRRGFVDGRILRLPTIVVRPGAPAAATSAFLSGIVREPLEGRETTCPIGDSPTSPELDLAVWVASPAATVANLLHAAHVPASAFRAHTRVVCAPGITTTVRAELDALRRVGGDAALARVRFAPDETNKRVVQSWPARIDNSYALGLGFQQDEGGMLGIVEQFKQDLDAQAEPQSA